MSTLLEWLIKKSSSWENLVTEKGNPAAFCRRRNIAAGWPENTISAATE